uniref:Uncharacterized protein LOC105133032 isoform X1 n=1 Tax=Rhizophora mucronata TaxID=61149 RepID=A0A2P2PT51_RHIMU
MNETASSIGMPQLQRRNLIGTGRTNGNIGSSISKAKTKQ